MSDTFCHDIHEKLMQLPIVYIPIMSDTFCLDIHEKLMQLPVVSRAIQVCYFISIYTQVPNFLFLCTTY